MGAVLGLLNIYCTHWKDGHPLPNGLVEDELFGLSDEKLDPYNKSNGRYTNQFFEMILENHHISYKYTDSFNFPFIYFLETCLTSTNKPKLNTSLHRILTHEICDAINERGLLVLYDSEGYKSHTTLMHNELRFSNIDMSRVVCISAARQTDSRLTSFFISHLGEELYNSFLRNKSKTIKALRAVKDVKPYKTFTCLVGRGDSSHKALLAKRMFENNFIASSHFSLTLLYKQAYKKIIPKQLVNQIPIYAEPYTDDRDIVYDLVWAQYSHLKLASESYINIVPTSTYREEKGFAPEGRLSNDFYMSVIAKRPFVVVSNFPNYLEIIKSLGYKTFDSILDESYDSEPDLQHRMKMIMNELTRLSKSNLVSTLEQCDDIFTHNLNVFMTKRTSQPFVDYLQSLSLYT